MLRSPQARAGDRHAHGKTNTTAKIDPWIGGCVGRPYKFSPSEGLPKGSSGQNGKCDVKKKKNKKEPDNIHADSEFGLGLKQLFKLLQRHIVTGGIMHKETDLNGDKAAK